MADPVVTGAELATPGIPDPPPRADPAPVVAEATPPQSTPVSPETVSAPPAETKAEPEVPATVSEMPSLLEQAKAPGSVEEPPKVEEPAKVEEPPKAEPEKPAETKPAEPAKVEAEKPAEAPKVETPVEPEKPAPVEYKYDLGEELALDDTRRTEFHGILDGLRVDPSNAQPLVDFHKKAMADFAQATTERQHKVFNQTRMDWQKQIMSDEELGGSGFQTTVKTVARMRDKLISSAPPGSEQYRRDAVEADKFFRLTGSGDHPVFWKMLHNAARYLDERQASDVPHDQIKAPPDAGRGQRTRRQIVYDHPTSPNNRNG